MSFAKIGSSFTHVSALVLAALATGVAPTALQGSEEDLPLTESNETLNENVQAALGPESEWNCLAIEVVERGLWSITPNYRSGEAEYEDKIRVLTKELLAETVFASNGQIGQWRDDGTLYGVEFDVFLNDPTQKPQPGEYLSVLGRVQGNGLDGTYGPLGKMYCYDQELYEARAQAIADMMGGVPLAEHQIWMGEVLHATAATGTPLKLVGNSNTFYGDAKTHGSARIGGDFHLVQNHMRYRLGVSVHGDGHELGELEPEGVVPYLRTRNKAAWYRAQAIAAGTYFSGDVVIVPDANGAPMTLSGVPVSGIVYSAGSISVEGSNLTAVLTLVSAEDISISASSSSITAAADGVLAYADSRECGAAISLDGNSNLLRGVVLAPRSEFRLSGSSNTFFGRSVARRITVSGSENFVSDGTRQ